MPKVTEIPAKKQVGSLTKQTEARKLRVAAYCRVSTDYEEQASSYQTQIQHYEEVINKNPDWELAGIFADDGISATSTKRREQFNKMIQACKDGLIDMIIGRECKKADADHEGAPDGAWLPSGGCSSRSRDFTAALSEF